MYPTLFDIVTRIDPEVIIDVSEKAGGAAYIISPNMVRKNVLRLKKAISNQYSNSLIAYSFKTNYFNSLISAAVIAGAAREVVSLQEFNYARTFQTGSDVDIIFNGPGKNEKTLKIGLNSQCTLIADSISELKKIAHLSKEVNIQARLGIRVSPKLSFMDKDSRFGIDLTSDENIQMINQLVMVEGLSISGVHMHITKSRSIESYIERIDYLVDCWNKIGIGKLTFLDCGGGFASNMPSPIEDSLPYPVADLEAYGIALGKHMKRLFPSQDVTFICEPGTGLLADSGLFITPVLEVKKMRTKNIAVVDGTIFSVNPLRSAAKPLVHVASRHEVQCDEQAQHYDIYGNSCMEIDLLVSDLKGPINEGDLLIFAQKGGYAACMSSPFIQGLPAAIEIDDWGRLQIVRYRSEYTSFYI